MVYIENLRETTGKRFETVGEPVGDFVEKHGTLEKLMRDKFFPPIFYAFKVYLVVASSM